MAATYKIDGDLSVTGTTRLTGNLNVGGHTIYGANGINVKIGDNQIPLAGKMFNQNAVYFGSHSAPTTILSSEARPRFETNGDYLALVSDTAKMTETTWAALKALRDGGNLVPGMQYRITDYQCTTTTENTSSAGHQFDVIVTADDANTLNENARAIQHNPSLNVYNITFSDGVTLECYLMSYQPGAHNIISRNTLLGIKDQTLTNWSGTSATATCASTDLTKAVEPFYFSQNNLSAWRIQYCLDNDTAKFTWADSANGKGVIYRMIDEFGNECPYDFKNIQFKRYKIDVCEKAPTLEGKYLGIEDGQGYTIDEEDFIWNYTFTWVNEDSEAEDCSIVGQTLPNDEGLYIGVFNNKIGIIPAYSFGSESPESFQLTLNDIVIQATYEYDDGFFYGMYGNIFGDNCHSNTIGNSCYYNAFGNDCYSNTFGDNCYSNTFGNNCCSNTFGDSCHSNTIGNNCNYNIFGNNCASNAFGNDCHSNAFGNGCSSNTFENVCTANAFGNDCYSNTFGNDCHSNTFGASCTHITFSDNCSYITFGDSSSTIDYCQNIIIDNGCEFLYINSSDTVASSSNQLQNVHVHLGVAGPSYDNYLTLTVSDRNLQYETNYEKTGYTTKRV